MACMLDASGWAATGWHTEPGEPTTAQLANILVCHEPGTCVPFYVTVGLGLFVPAVKAG